MNIIAFILALFGLVIACVEAWWRKSVIAVVLAFFIAAWIVSAVWAGSPVKF